MNHQPFETWLLSDEPLSPEDQAALETHLNTCQHCRELEEAWLGVVGLFQDVPEVEPADGFTQRWMTRLAMEKQLDQAMRHRWQAIIMLILFANVITGLVILLGTQFFTTFDTPISLVMSGVYRLTSTVALINTVQNVSFTLLRTIVSVVPVGIWAVLGLGLIGSIATWIVSITSLSVLPRRS